MEKNLSYLLQSFNRAFILLEMDKVFQKRVENKEKLREKYIPGLALFKFKPKKYWSIKEAQTY